MPAPEPQEIGSRCATCGQRHDAEQDRDAYHEALLVGLLRKQSEPTDEAAFWAAHGGRRLLSNKVRADDYWRDLTKAEADSCDLRVKLDLANARTAAAEADAKRFRLESVEAFDIAYKLTTERAALEARVAELEAELDATDDERAVLKAVGEVGPRALKNPRTYGEDFAEVCEAALAWRKAKEGT